MEELANLAREGCQVLITPAKDDCRGATAESRPAAEALSSLMRRNHETRERLYGREALSRSSLRMVDIAGSVGAGATFAGSGGSVVAACPGGAEQLERLQAACATHGFACVRVQIAGPFADLP